ncbi:TniQ family protein [Streptomyces tsukubensis]|uniref:TniQ family protein n=1 Tax=Streptomyces tsukubensis TaxID=83656 RepID=UPI00345019F6
MTDPAPITADELPLRVPLIPTETTLSLLTRTATANGAPLRALLAVLVADETALPGEEPAPQREELRLDAEGLGRLAALLGREREQLARTLPGARDEQLADAVRLTPWPADRGAAPLPACPLCMEPGAWLAAEGSRWRPCPCGRRWMIGDDGGALVDTGPVPDLARALHRHRDLVHRAGHVGDALVADALQVMLWWWTSGPALPVWRDREDALRMSRHRRRAAPVAVYPEAVTLAEAMWTWEERRHHKNAPTAARWAESAAHLFHPDRPLGRRDLEPLRYWLEQHQAQPGGRPRGRTADERRWNRLPTLHTPPAEPGLLRAPSCLMWVHGLPLTSTTEVCTRCDGRAPSCRWVPYPGCTGRPKK